MKSILIAFVLVIAALPLSAQTASCCEPVTKAPGKFASFGEDENFRNMHPSPSTRSVGELKGKMISYEHESGESAAYFIPGDKDSKKAILVIHEWWGLNEHIKSEADRLYADMGGKAHVIAIDMYQGEVATTADKATELMKSVETEFGRNVILGAADFLPRGTEIGTIGWCFGGGWSLQAAIELEDRVVGSVIYYGMPESDRDRLEAVRCPVLGIFAGEDGWITPEIVEEFEELMNEMGKEVKVRIFEGAQHAFANPSRDIYNQDAASAANEMTTNFFRKNLLGLE